MAHKVLNEQFIGLNEMNNEPTTDAILSIDSMTTLLTETNSTLKQCGVDIEDPDLMKHIYRDEATANMYIDGLSEGLEGDDIKTFKTLCHTMLDEINGRGAFANRSTLHMLMEDNNSVGFMPKAKVIFPMFRFTWPRLHIREICTVIPADSPEMVRYFFKAVAKNPDNSIVPLPSYSPIGNGQAIGTMATPFAVSLPSTADLLGAIGATNANTHLEKNFMIVGWEAIDPTGAIVSDKDTNLPMLYTVDADGKFEFQVDCDPKLTSSNAVIDVVSGFVDFEKGVISVSNSRANVGMLTGDSEKAKVTKIFVVCTASSAEHNIAPRIVFDSKQIKFQIKDVQLQSEWSEQYAYDMSKRIGMDVISELTCILGNQLQLTINRTILDDILFHVGRHGDNIRSFIADPTTARPSFAYTRKQWADELLFNIEKASARIYTATNNMECTHIVCNPEDLVWLQMLDSFAFSGDFIKGGSYGRSNVGSVSNGKQILSTPLMPQGYMLLASKPADVTLANYIFTPYVPITISPYPLGFKKSLAQYKLGKIGKRYVHNEYANSEVSYEMAA